jgi:tetratricopeptide (TPR) repeat protein
VGEPSQMLTVDWLKRAVNDSSELSKRGNNDEALKLLDASIRTALGANKVSWVQTLCRHASAIADFAGDLASVRRYRELAVQHAANDAQNLYGLADILLRQGDAEIARSMATKAYALIRESSDELDRGLAELLIKRWPELKNPTRPE